VICSHLPYELRLNVAWEWTVFFFVFGRSRFHISPLLQLYWANLFMMLLNMSRKVSEHYLS